MTPGGWLECVDHGHCVKVERGSDPGQPRDFAGLQPWIAAPREGALRTTTYVSLGAAGDYSELLPSLLVASTFRRSRSIAGSRTPSARRLSVVWIR